MTPHPFNKDSMKKKIGRPQELDLDAIRETGADNAELLDRISKKLDVVLAQRDDLLSAAKEVFKNLEDGYIAQDSFRAERNRRRLERDIRQAIEACND